MQGEPFSVSQPRCAGVQNAGLTREHELLLHGVPERVAGGARLQLRQAHQRARIARMPFKRVARPARNRLHLASAASWQLQSTQEHDRIILEECCNTSSMVTRALW